MCLENAIFLYVGSRKCNLFVCGGLKNAFLCMCGSQNFFFFLVCGISKFNFLYVDVQKMQNFVGFSKKHFHVSGGLENSVFCVCGLENAIFVCGGLENATFCKWWSRQCFFMYVEVTEIPFLVYGV